METLTAKVNQSTKTHFFIFAQSGKFATEQHVQSNQPGLHIGVNIALLRHYVTHSC